ncbi:MAG: phage portal protein [Bacteroidetes bacterium]|nr:phage portal protein [Bacteroidota bacterium]
MALQLISPTKGIKNFRADSLIAEMLYGQETDAKHLTIVEAYRVNGFLRACVDMRAAAIGGIPFTVVNAANPEDIRYDSDADYDLPDELGFMTGWSDLIFKTEASLILVGSAFWLKVYDNGNLVGLQWMSPNTIQPLYDQAGKVYAYKRTVNGREVTLDVEDVVAIYQQDPLTEIGPGSSIGYAARTGADVLHSLQTYLDSTLDNGLLKATLIGVPMGTPREERDRIERGWRSWFSGKGNAGTTKVVEADAVNVQTIGEGIKDLGNLQLSREQRELIAVTLGVPFSFVISGAANFATAQQDDVNFYTKTVLPQADRIAHRVNATLLRELGVRFSFEPKRLEVMQRYEVEKAQALAQLTGGAPVLTVDEARALLGYGPVQQVTQQVTPQVTPEVMEEEVQDDTQAIESEIRAWRRKVKSRGADAPFSPDNIPEEVYHVIKSRLEDGEDYKSAFSPPFDF